MGSSESKVDSPCVSVCVLDDHNICKGCGRLADEIMAWPLANDERRQQIVRNAAKRMTDVPERVSKA